MKRALTILALGLALTVFSTSSASADHWNRSWRNGVRQYNQSVRQFNRAQNRYENQWNRNVRYYRGAYGSSSYYYGHPRYSSGVSVNFGNGGFYYYGR